MASVKIVLRKKKNIDGTFPLAIRITKDRKSSYIHLGKHVRVTDWDMLAQRVKSKHPNSSRLNNFLINKLSEASDKLLELETHKNDISSHAVKQGIKPSAAPTFFPQAKLYIDNLTKSGKYNQASADEPRINRLKEFVKIEDLAFQDITVPFLNRFRAYLIYTRHISERTVVNHLVVIRTIFNQAIKASLVEQKHYPFGKDNIKIKFPESVKIGLNQEEIKLIEEVQLDSHPVHHARNLWLFSFYLAGMRISDVLRLKWSDFQNERLHYAMGKNTKAGSLKMNEKPLKILSQYEYNKKSLDDLVFSELKMIEDLRDTYLVQQKINTAVKKIDAHLKTVAKLAGVHKNLSMHISRHSFGNISGDKIPIQMLQKLYRHSSIITTIGYQSNFIHKDTDEALDAVINF